MKNTKRRIETISFFDHTGISEHLEKMAEKGWMIERIASVSWIYRRIEPKKVHFAVSYYPKASEFDPEPSEEQKMFFDFCEHTGWQLTCTSAQMQIFYNERENPTPIETEPELELRASHASAKKSLIPPFIIYLLIGSMNIASLIGNPISLLADPTRLVTVFIFLLLNVLSCVELGCYFIWYSKAKKAAERGEFLKTYSTSRFQKVVFALVATATIYWGVNYLLGGSSPQRWIVICLGIYVPALFFITDAIKRLLKRKKASKGINLAVTLSAGFLVAVVILGLLNYVVLTADFRGFFAGRNEKTYEHNGMTWVISQDELPLVVEDLVDMDYDGYIKKRDGSSSLLLSRLKMSQQPRFDAENFADIPQLEYVLTIVRVPALYDFCRERLLYGEEALHKRGEKEFRSEDAEAWGANEAYRLYDAEFGAQNVYLLCYDDLFVEIYFDWEPTKEQKGIVGEKVGG